MESPNQFNSGVLAVDKSSHPLFPWNRVHTTLFVVFQGDREQGSKDLGLEERSSEEMFRSPLHFPRKCVKLALGKGRQVCISESWFLMESREKSGMSGNELMPDGGMR